MGSLTNLSLVSLMIVSLTACGQSVGTSSSSPPPKKTEVIDEPIDGGSSATQLDAEYVDLEGSRVDLKAATKAQVVMLVSDICSICRKETLALAKRFNSTPPSEVDFHSILIGSTTDDARAWSEELGVMWAVGIDEENKVFKKYCPEGLTPCALVRSREGKITKFVGESDLKEWEEITGEWK